MDDNAIRGEIEKMADDTVEIPLDSADEAPAFDIPAYQAFPVHFLPEPVRSYVTASASAIGCDPALVALPQLAALASAIGNRRRIALKKGWAEPAILWTLIVATSGSHKSPAFDLAVSPVKKRQEKARRQYVEAVEQYDQALEEYKVKLKRWQSQGRGEAPRKPNAPIMPRTWTDNTTIEALAVLLQQQPTGLLLACDELSAWFASFDRYSKNRANGDAARWMHLHGGRSFVVDRRTTATIHVENGAISVCGSIQPEVLRRTLTQEQQENGMAARFLFAMPPKREKRWTDAEVDENLERAVLSLFDRLHELQHDQDEDGQPVARVLHLTAEAKHDIWIPFYNAHAKEQIALEGNLSAAWSKLEGYAARLAQVHHLIRVAANDPSISDPDVVDAESMAAGIALSQWFGLEARRVYALLAEDGADQAERELVELIERLGGTVTPRDLQRHSRKYRRAADAEAALQNLANGEKGAWQCRAASSQGGRPIRHFVLRRHANVDTTIAKHTKNVGSVNANGKVPDDRGYV